MERRAGLPPPSAGEEAHGHEESHDRKPDRYHRLWNGERYVGCEASLIEGDQLTNGWPGENDEHDRGSEENQFGQKIEGFADFRRHHPAEKIHSDVAARTSPRAAAKE